MIKIIFYGTAEFAATILEAVIENKNYEILAVVTQPDKPVGRHQKMQKTPVKIIAEKYNLKILQPEKLKKFDDESLDQADISVVVQYGKIIPTRLLNKPKYKTLNLHGSILPQHRGASPIQSAILHGGTKTGITLMLMDEKMDHGPIIAIKSIDIEPDELVDQLSIKLATTASELLLNKIKPYINGEIIPKEQNHNIATFCKIITRDDGRINWEKTSIIIYNQYRALTPWPGIWTKFNNKRLKLLKIKLADKTDLQSGEISIENSRLFIGCSNNSSIEILELQLEGKKSWLAKDFINSFQTKIISLKVC